MRTALPNAFFFGLTGTPINRADKNTFRKFGAAEDESGYMSRCTFGDSVRDEEAKILDKFREKSSPLKLLIVTSKLLTGFDAPRGLTRQK